MGQSMESDICKDKASARARVTWWWNSDVDKVIKDGSQGLERMEMSWQQRTIVDNLGG